MKYVFQKSHIKVALVCLPIGVGLALLMHDYLEYQEGLSSTNWVEADGKVLSNSIKADRKDGRMIFIPQVSYSYHINDDAFRGARMTYPDNMASSEKDLKQLLQRLEVGHHITSYHDPKNISHVTLVRGVRHAKYAMLFVRDAVVTVVIPFLLVALGMLLFPKPKNKSKLEPKGV